MRFALDTHPTGKFTVLIELVSTVDFLFLFLHFSSCSTQSVRIYLVGTPLRVLVFGLTHSLRSLSLGVPLFFPVLSVSVSLFTSGVTAVGMYFVYAPGCLLGLDFVPCAA